MGQGKEEWAECYRQRVAAIEKVLSDHDSEQQNPAAWPDGALPKMDWRNPSEAMRKVGYDASF